MCSSARVKRVKEEEQSDSVTEIQLTRRREPEHFLLKVESFSESNLEKYESDEFDAEGYKWRLILYPNGDKERNGSNHVSLYLSICDTQNLPLGWEVEADFSFFVYNSLSQKYRICELAEKTRFNWLKTESGFAQLIPLDEFKETSNGYLFGDACVFGAEIYVAKSIGIAKRQILSMKKKIDTNIFTWTIGNFSTLNDARLQSENFIIGDVKWNLVLYPKGTKGGKDKSLSVFLALADGELTELAKNQKVNAEYTLRIKNQFNSNHDETRETFSYIFSDSSPDWGDDDLVPISEVYDKSKGFLKNDSLVVEVEFTKVEIIKNCK